VLRETDLGPEAWGHAAQPVHPERSRGTSPWLISRGQDLFWFQGSVLAGVALLAFFALGPRLTDATYSAAHPAVLALLLWGIFFDGTHVLGTLTHPRAAAAGRWAWLLVLAGPAVAVIDYFAILPEPSQLGSAGWLFRAFLLFAYLWAYFHLVRQHYGFVALYRRRAGATDWIERRLETWVLWVGCLYPFLRYSLSAAYADSGLPVLLPGSALPGLRLALDLAFAVLGTGLLAALLVRARANLGPRHLLIGTVIAFHLAVFALLDNLLTITATLTIFHNLQYHRIIWDHARAEGRKPAGGLGRYLALGLMLGAAWYGPRILGVALVESDLARNALLGLGWGVAFQHYFVDGKIWKRAAVPG